MLRRLAFRIPRRDPRWRPAQGKRRWKSTEVDSATWITLFGAGTNVFLGTLKVGVGTVWGSPALVSDGAHSFSDLVSDAVALVTYAEARRPPDANHTYGHGKLESAGALAVGAMLLTVAGGTAVNASAAFIDVVWNVQDSVTTMGLVPGGVCLVSIAVKECLFRATKAVGEEARSAVVVANAYHHRSDALSSVAAFIGVALSFIHPACDPAAGLLVAVMVGKSGLDISKQALDELCDAVDPNIVKRLSEAVQDDIGPGNKLTSLKARTSGGALIVDADLLVSSPTGSTLTASAAHHIADHAKQRLLRAANDSLGLQVLDLTLQLDCYANGRRPSSKTLLPPPNEVEDHIRAAIRQSGLVQDVSDVALIYTEDAVKAKVAVRFNTSNLTLREAKELARTLRRQVRSATLLRLPTLRLGLDVVCALPPDDPPEDSLIGKRRPP